MSGAEFRAVRNRLGLTQVDLADLIGVSRWAIIRAERTAPSENVVMRCMLARKTLKKNKH